VVVARCPTSGCSSWRSSRTSSGQELSPLEEAQAYQKLHDEFELTQEEVARRVGKDRSTVANTVRLLRLPKDVRDLLGPVAWTRDTAVRCWRSSAPRISWRWPRTRPRAASPSARSSAGWPR
jgi:hypothetical protein